MFQIRRTDVTNLDVKSTNSFVASIFFQETPGKEVAPELQFRLETYRDLSSSQKFKEGEEILAPLNAFLLNLDLPSQIAAYNYFRDAKNYISEITPDNYKYKIEELVQLTTGLFKETKLDYKILQFVLATDIPYPPLEGIGTRAHDTKEMTFHLNEYKELTAVSLMCKLLCPIWGELFRVITDDMTDTINQELFCFNMILPALKEGCFKTVYDKLKNYIVKNVQTVLTKQLKHSSPSQSPVLFTMSKNGFGEERIIDLVTAVILVRKLVIYDVYRARGNTGKPPDVMKYISVSINATTSSKISHMRMGTKEMIRIDPRDSRSDQDNVTYNDNLSRVSQNCADAPYATSISVDIELEKILKIAEIDLKLFNAILKFYQRNPVESVNPFAECMVSNLLSDRLGGSRVTDWLGADQYNKIIACVQLLMMKWGFVNLIPLMSCTTSNTPSENEASATMSLTIKTTAEYKECCRRFVGVTEKTTPAYRKRRDGGKRPSEFEKINIEVLLKLLLDWISGFEHQYSMPPVLWEALGRFDDNQPLNGSILVYDDLVMRDTCGFILKLLEPESPITKPKPVDVLF